jgi:3-hydroxyisobutyrate dehydrogenase-like beta-hydroxyacid dehydrogenase
MMQNENVTVIGLGSMGLKLVDLLQKANYSLTVWNRTIDKARSLTDVSVSKNIDNAIAASNTIVICVYDYAAVTSLLHQLQNKQLLSGKTVINFTTGSPKEANELEGWLNRNSAGFINGALQVAPDQM